MHNLIAKTIGFLEIKKPYRIILKPKFRPNVNRAEYWERHRKGVLVRHDIAVSMWKMAEEGRSLEVLIAHEFIHAWQAENGILCPKSYHDKLFQKMAKKLGKHLELDGLYLKEIDV